MSCVRATRADVRSPHAALNDILYVHTKVGEWATYRDKLEEYVEFPFEIDMAPFLPEAALAQAQEEFIAAGGIGVLSNECVPTNQAATVALDYHLPLSLIHI